MNLILRLLKVAFKAFFGRRLGLLEESVIGLRVWPNDLDIYGHMNNGQYLTLMDLGRMDLILRTPLGEVSRKNRWNPLVASATIRFKKPIRVFDALYLHTRILCWDEKWFFIEQKFERNGEWVALGVVRGLFRGRNGNVPSVELIKALGEKLQSPTMPESVKLWLNSENS